MKRFFVSILAILYLASASGASLHLHYCMGQLIDIGFTEHGEKDDACENCGMKQKKNNNCCKDEHKIIKAQYEHTEGVKANFEAKNFTAAPALLIHYAPYQYSYSFTKNKNAWSHAPPLPARSCPIYILVGNFRI